MKDVLNFGAIGDGETDCTEAIQAAIDEAAAEGGGRVYFPAGKYLSRTIFLKDNCVLRLESGAELLASLDYRTYGHPDRKPLWFSGSGNPMWTQYWAFIIAVKAMGVGIEGNGVINGRGKYKANFPNPEDPEKRRPFLVIFDRCKDCFLHDITLKDPACYNFLGFDVRNMQIRGVKVLSRESGNGDGLDFDGGRDVTISDCYVDAGDDAISLKTTKKGEICERFAISNCILKSCWAAIRFGTESTDTMRDITVSGCVFENCRDGLKIQSCGGALYENMVFSSITMRNVIRPFFITANRFRMSCDEEEFWPKGSRIQDLIFSDIVVDMPSDGKMYDHTGFVVSGTKDNIISGLSFRNVKVKFYGDGKPKNLDVPQLYDYSQQYPEMPHLGELPTGGVFVRYAENIMFSDCSFTYKNPDPRPVMFCDHAGVSLVNTMLQSGVQEYCSKIEGADTIPLIAEEKGVLQRSYEKAEKFYCFAQQMAALADRALSLKNRKEYGYDKKITLPEYETGYLLVSVLGDLELFLEDKPVRISAPGNYERGNRIVVELPKGIKEVSFNTEFRGEPTLFFWE